MGRELEEGLIRTHQPEKLQRKRKKVPAPICGTTLFMAESLSEQAQGLVNKIEAGATTFRGKI